MEKIFAKLALCTLCCVLLLSGCNTGGPPPDETPTETLAGETRPRLTEDGDGPEATESMPPTAGPGDSGQSAQTTKSPGGSAADRGQPERTDAAGEHSDPGLKDNDPSTGNTGVTAAIDTTLMDIYISNELFSQQQIETSCQQWGYSYTMDEGVFDIYDPNNTGSYVFGFLGRVEYPPEYDVPNESGVYADAWVCEIGYHLETETGSREVSTRFDGRTARYFTDGVEVGTYNEMREYLLYG